MRPDLTAKGAAVGGAIGGAVVGVAAALRPHGPAGRAARRVAETLPGRLRHLEGVLRGVRYRITGGRPTPDASDDVLVDRVRSELGPIEKQLDLPRVHVMVHDHVVMVHGAVSSESEARALHDAVAKISGVEGVESHLHVGLGPGDTRPSEGHLTETPSEALERLTEAAHRVGVGLGGLGRGQGRPGCVRGSFAAGRGDARAKPSPGRRERVAPATDAERASATRPSGRGPRECRRAPDRSG